MDSASGGMVLRIDGTPSAIVTSLDLSLSNAGEHKLAAFQTTPQRIATGRSNLTGNLGLYFTSSTYWTKYLSEVSQALGLVLMDPAGLTGYAIDIPNVRLSTFPKPNVSENDVVTSLPWQALRDSTLGLVNWKWHKLA
ncbi:MAG: hypothetical protein EHM13_13765 [Acidobacteria bacterium]|nr:MAG: hypothetical protein EHM13_13765 [Acidobacteriota bacterium]